MPDPEHKIEPPRFLTQGEALSIMNGVVAGVRNSEAFANELRPHGIHVIIYAPMRVIVEEHDIKDTFLGALAEHSFQFDSDEPWPGPYGEIANSKGGQVLDGRRRSGPFTPAHMLLRGDTRYWGQVERDGYAAAASGQDPYIDRLVAGQCIDGCIAKAALNFKRWEAANPTAAFV